MSLINKSFVSRLVEIEALVSNKPISRHSKTDRMDVKSFVSRLAALEKHVANEPNPRELYTTLFPSQVDVLRRLHCVHYEKCLMVACDANWQSFACDDCMIHEDISPEELRKQADGIMAAISNGNRVLAQDL